MRRWLISATIRIPLAPSWQRPGKTPSVKQGGGWNKVPDGDGNMEDIPKKINTRNHQKVW
jgi:hypothetical protein